MLKALGDSTLFGDVSGEGPIQVLFLPGWAHDSSDFAGVARALAAHGVASLSLDLPGFGSSPPPRRATGARGYAEVVGSVLDEIAEGPLVLFGHSFGGKVATALAAQWPDRVRSLILCGAPVLRQGPRRRPPWGFRVARAARRARLVPESVLERARQRYGSSDYRAARGVMREVLVATLGESLDEELDRVKVPVTLLWGERDEAVPLEVARAALTHLSNARLEVLDGIGHLVPTEAPGAVERVVREALS